ncbi:MAG: hypothetical protein LC437_05280, partial [Thiohalomonas sp.]|nr:hypothetical protein [Thiohalomonas sp.]
MLSSIGRLTKHGRQKKMVISSTHGDITTLKSAYIRLVDFFYEFKTTVTQLNYNECWSLILAKAMEKFKVNLGS